MLFVLLLPAAAAQGQELPSDPGDRAPTPAPTASEELPEGRKPSRRGRSADADLPTVFGFSPRQQLYGVGAVGGAFAGGMAAWAVGEGVAAVGPGLFGAGGALAFGVYSERNELRATSGVRAGTHVAIGTWAGWELARIAVPEGDADATRRIAAAAAFGDLSGMGLALALPERADWTLDEWALVDGSGLAGWLAGAGIATLVDGSVAGGGSRQLHGAAELLGGAAFTGLAAAAAQFGTLDANLAQGTLWTGQGAWIGAWAPSLLHENPSSREIAAGLELGAALGWTTSLLVDAGPTDIPSFVSATAWAATGSALGAGIPLVALGEDARVPAVGSMLLAGVAGSAVGTSLADRYDEDAGETILVLGGQAWGAWQGAGWAARQSMTHPGDDRRALGAGLAGYAGGAAYGLGVPLLADLDANEAVMAGSAGAWGSLLGLTIGTGVHMEDAHHLALSLGLGDAALLATTAAVAGPWDPSGVDLALVNGGGLLGAGMGALGATVVAPDTDTVAVGAAIGGLTGLGMGYALSTRTEAQLTTRPRIRLPFRLTLTPSPWVDASGKTGVFLEARLLERPT